MTLGKKHKWTAKEVSTLKEMRGDGRSFQQIADTLGTVGRDTVRKKYGELEGKPESRSTSKRKPWTKEEDEIIIKGYKNKRTANRISEDLGGRRSIESIYVRASALNVTDKAKHKNRSSTAKKEPNLKTSHEHDAKHESSKPETIKEAYVRLGWKPTMGPFEMLNHRSKVEQKTKRALGQEIDRKNPAHVTVLLHVAGNHIRRSIVDISKLTLLPLHQVEAVFSHLDSQDIWPASEAAKDKMTAKEYEQMIVICKREMNL